MTEFLERKLRSNCKISWKYSFFGSFGNILEFISKRGHYIYLYRKNNYYGKTTLCNVKYYYTKMKDYQIFHHWCNNHATRTNINARLSVGIRLINFQKKNVSNSFRSHPLPNSKYLGLSLRSVLMSKSFHLQQSTR